MFEMEEIMNEVNLVNLPTLVLILNGIKFVFST